MITTLCGREAFTYWPDPKLVDIDDAKTLIKKYKKQDGAHHYFDKNTMKYFGTQDFTVIEPGISVEYQSEVPDEIGKWAVVAWVENTEHDEFVSYHLCRHNSEDEANDCGHFSFGELMFDYREDEV